MCTLVIGINVVSPETVIVGANRDEDPARPSRPPDLIRVHPRLVGGRDLTAGGTWLAMRERQMMVAILNRAERGPPGRRGPPSTPLRSRGLLVLDVASTSPEDFARLPLEDDTRKSLADEEDPLVRLALGAATVAIHSVLLAGYAPFSLVCATAAASFLIAHDGVARPRLSFIPDGWHAITHRDLDDRGEPRTARVLDELAKFRPRSADDAMEGIAGILRLHGEGGPPVCLHEGLMVTVSSSLVWLARDEARYRHAEGRPCEVPYVDHSHLLAGRLERP